MMNESLVSKDDKNLPDWDNMIFTAYLGYGYFIMI